MSCKDLAISFFRTGILGYGGGPSVIPLIRYETVEKYKWMDEDEFADVFSLANALPGPIATKMATYIGYRVKGFMGAICALLSHALPTVVIMIAILGSLYALNKSSIIKGMIEAVGPVIGMMLAVMAYEFLKKSWKGLGKAISFAMILISVVLLQLMGIHPAIVISLFIVVALIKTFYKKRKYSETNNPV
jgi:chromate transporter